MSDGPITSSGAVNIQYGRFKADKVYFKPDTHHTIEHGGKKYAVFVGTPQSDRSVTLHAWAIEVKDNHIEVGVDDQTDANLLDALGQAAIKSVGVDITVEMNGKLAGIERNAEEISTKAAKIRGSCNEDDIKATAHEIGTKVDEIKTKVDEIRNNKNNKLLLRGAVIPAKSHKK